MRTLFARLKEKSPEGYKAYLEIVANKKLSATCTLDLTAQTLAAAFSWKDANKSEFFWEKVARQLGERETPRFENPCKKYTKLRA